MAERSITMRCEVCDHTRAITSEQATHIMDEAAPDWADELLTSACDKCEPSAQFFEAEWVKHVATLRITGAETHHG